MLLKNCLSFILAVFINQIEYSKPDSAEHDPTEIDSSLADTGLCYYFAYDSFINFTAFQEVVPTAQFYNEATLRGYRLDFARVGKDPDEVLTTLGIDETSEVLGLLYSVTVEDYEAYRDNNIVYLGKQISRSAAFKVEVEEEGKQISVKCNTLVSVQTIKREDPLPEDRRPLQETLTEIVTAMQGANIDQNYINKIASIPTQKC